MDKNNRKCASGVGCDVKGCKYNDTETNCCIAQHIQVENKAASTKSETFCNTFAPRSSF